MAIINHGFAYVYNFTYFSGQIKVSWQIDHGISIIQITSVFKIQNIFMIFKFIIEVGLEFKKTQ